MELGAVVMDCIIRIENASDLVRGLSEIVKLPPFIEPVTDRGVRVTGDGWKKMKITYQVWDTYRNPEEKNPLKAIVTSEHKCFVYDSDRGLVETDSEINY